MREFQLNDLLGVLGTRLHPMTMVELKVVVLQACSLLQLRSARGRSRLGGTSAAWRALVRLNAACRETEGRRTRFGRLALHRDSIVHCASHLVTQPAAALSRTRRQPAVWVPPDLTSAADSAPRAICAAVARCLGSPRVIKFTRSGEEWAKLEFDHYQPCRS